MENAIKHCLFLQAWNNLQAWLEIGDEMHGGRIAFYIYIKWLQLVKS